MDMFSGVVFPTTQKCCLLGSKVFINQNPEWGKDQGFWTPKDISIPVPPTLLPEGHIASFLVWLHSMLVDFLGRCFMVLASLISWDRCCNIFSFTVSWNRLLGLPYRDTYPSLRGLQEPWYMSPWSNTPISFMLVKPASCGQCCQVLLAA